MKTPAFLPRVLLALLLAGALAPAPPAQADHPIRALAQSISGGASLMRDLGRDEASEDFYDRSRRFADLARRGGEPDDLAQEWRRLRSTYRAARKANRRGREEGWRFLTTHLDEDFAAGDRLLGSAAAEEPRDTGGVRRLSLIRSEVCVGRNDTNHACPNRRDTLTFTLPRDIAVIKRFDTEWRDFGERGNGEIYINDRLVWRQDVNRDWDGDGKDLNVRIPAGSTITLRSANGDPIWVWKLTVDVLERADRDDYRDTWNLPWDPWR